MPIRARTARAPRPRPASDSNIEPPTSTSLFTYGSLADERQVASLLSRPAAASRAELLDYERVDSGAFPYPLIVAAPGARVEGKLYRHLTEEEFARLDAYEGVADDLYRRELARVVRPGGDAAGADEAWVYVPSPCTLARRAR
jgi:gamma-glutamylcyclotransferase (GGCT)/AIG2-like uncharacterized protein YtfP